MIQLIKDLFRLSKYNTFFFLILRAGTRFAASKMVVRKKKSLQGSTTNNDLSEKFYGVKTMRLLECYTLAHQEGNKPDFWWCTLSKFLNIALIFLIVFPSWHCLYIKGRFFIKHWNVFLRCTCGYRYSFAKSKRKNIIEN